MFSQTCLIHRVRFYYPPSCAYALLSYSPVLGFRVNQEKGTSDRRRKQRSEKQPPPPSPPSSHRRTRRHTGSTYDPVCARVCVCCFWLLLLPPKLLTYEVMIGRVRPHTGSDASSVVRAHHHHAGRKDLATICFPFFFITLPLVASLWWRGAVCVFCMYV